MSKFTGPWAFLCLALVLVVWPLTLQRPGLPYSLKADEPAYYLAARSLWHDGDLRCEPRDLMRLGDDFFSPAANLILMTRDRWRTAYYGKPYFASLVAAPLVELFGPGGYFALNMAYLLLAAALGYVYLARFNAKGEALLFACGYYLVSTAFVYVFWLHPEVQGLASVAAALFFSLHEFDPPAANGRAPGRLARLARGLFNDRTRWLWAGLAIGPAVTARPIYALALLPGAVQCLWRRRVASLLALGLGAAVSTGAIAGGQYVLTGTWSPYLGTERRGFNVGSPLVMPTPEPPPAPVPVPAGAVGPPQAEPAEPRGGDWSWIFQVPRVNRDRVWLDLRNFFVGRHAGALVYYPFLLVGLLYFLSGGGWRAPGQVATLGALVGFTGFFVLWNFNNYHGGAGFVGNRYLVSFSPVGLYLARKLRPRWLMGLGFLLGGLFLGQVLFAPLGPVVDEPTLQAYTRARPFRWLPFEVNLPRQIPGYRGTEQSGAWITGRKDQLRFEGDWLTLLGRGDAELMLKRFDEPGSAAFLVRSYAPGNVARLRLGGERRTVRFPEGPPPAGGATALVSFQLGPPDTRFREWPSTPLERYWYLEVNTRHAARPAWWGLPGRDLVGLQLLYAGETERLEAPVYGASWLAAEAPAEVVADERFEVPVRLRNTSGTGWLQDSPVRVQLGYRWRDLDGAEVGALEVLRTPLGGPVPAGGEVSLEMAVRAPREPGERNLVLEPVYEYVRWFGDVDPAARLEVGVRVLPPPAPPSEKP